MGRHRYAIPYLLGPHLDTGHRVPADLQGPEAPAKQPPITYGEYMSWWYDAKHQGN